MFARLPLGRFRLSCLAKYLLAALLLFAPSLMRAEEDDRFATVSCGKDTVVLFGDTRSSDGRYALGWTIRPAAKDAKPVDWARLKEEGLTFLDRYPWEDTENGKATYSIIDGIVDLSLRSFKELPVAWAFYTTSTHGWNIEVAWLDSEHAIILVNRRFYTEDVFLVRPASDPLEVRRLLPQMNEQVDKLMQTKRALTSDWCISYDLGEMVTMKKSDAEVMERMPCKIENGVMYMRFWAGFPKGSFEDLEGHLLVSLKDGKSLRAISGDPADQPFVGKLGEADKSLNQVYAQLRKLLSDGEFRKLQADQKEWISQRNEESRREADEKVRHGEEGSELKDYRTARNQVALALTLERVDMLARKLDELKRR